MTDEIRAEISNAVWRTMKALTERDDNFLIDIFRRSRVEREDAYRVMDEYGAKFVTPPQDAYDNISITDIGGNGSNFAVDVYFWDGDGRKTDLSAEMTIKYENKFVHIEIDDVRVM